jgi:hypothetical protein
MINSIAKILVHIALVFTDNLCTLWLFFQLLGVMQDYLGAPAIELDFPGHANAFSLQSLFRLTEFRTIAPENHGGENLRRVRLSEVQKRRL